jgi:hypothetical protein
MREWLLVIAPLAMVVYFLAFQISFGSSSTGRYHPRTGLQRPFSDQAPRTPEGISARRPNSRSMSRQAAQDRATPDEREDATASGVEP